MCGLFGNHKNHRITTRKELVGLNKALAEKSKLELNRIGEGKLKRAKGFTELINKVCEKVVKKFRKDAMGECEVGSKENLSGGKGKGD